MRFRSPARYLAPLALVAAVVVVVVIVRETSGDGGDPKSSSPTPTATERRGPARRFYTVRAGDNLSRVAERTGVPVNRILELNPRLDPNALRPGQRLRLAP
jgi:LysM repeat protein